MYVPNVNDRVYFGRSHGEKTLGEVIKVNRVSCKVRQLEARGTMRDYPVGTVWTVALTLVSPAPAGTSPAPETPAAPKRSEAVILDEIRSCYARLSPENLHCDGEIPLSVARRRGAAVNRRLRDLFRELGRHVSETEAFA